MRKVSIIALLLIAVVCAPKLLRRAATSGEAVPLQEADSKAAPSAISSENLSVSDSTSQAITDESLPMAERSSDQALAMDGLSENQDSSSADANPDSAVSSSETSDPSRSALLAALAERPSAEAVILDETDGDSPASAVSITPDRGQQLMDLVQEHPDTASSDLLTMFQMEFNADNKMDILTASSLVGDDRNVWALLEAALSLSQPPEVRAEAAAFAVARNPDLLLSHFNDPDLLVQLEIQNSFILTAQPSKINSGFPTISLENLPPSQPRSN